MGINFKEMELTQSAAIGTNDLGAHAVGIQDAFHCALNLVVERRPAAMRIEFVGRIVKGDIALFAKVSPLPFVIHILPGVGIFSAFVQYNSFFFLC